VNILVTGAAGFIGAALSEKLSHSPCDQVWGVDNLNDYYDVNLKNARLEPLLSRSNFIFQKLDIANKEAVETLFKHESFDVVVNLAAQAGVRYSLQNPHAYISSNILGFTNILEACRHHKIKHLVYASSSSVYGLNSSLPFSVHQSTEHPASLYAATKKANEMMAHSYSHLFGLPTTGLRFFTAYGPWGRPDMAYFMFTKNILAGKPIQVFNEGNHLRDFTYIDDVVDGVERVIKGQAPRASTNWVGERPDPATSSVPFRLYNVGNNSSIQLMHYIKVLEDCLGQKAKIEFLPIQKEDVLATHANVDGLVEDFNYKPKISIEEGISNFVQWYEEYYQS